MNAVLAVVLVVVVVAAVVVDEPVVVDTLGCAVPPIDAVFMVSV